MSSAIESNHKCGDEEEGYQRQDQAADPRFPKSFGLDTSEI